MFKKMKSMSIQVTPSDYMSVDNIAKVQEVASTLGIPFELALLKHCNIVMNEVRQLKRKKFGDAAIEFNEGEPTPDIGDMDHKEKVEFIEARKEATANGVDIDPTKWVDDLNLPNRASNVLREHFSSLNDLRACDLKTLKKLKGMGPKSYKEVLEVMGPF